jgi:hypothetical protein
MTLSCPRLTQTDTTPPALACLTPSLVTPLSAIRIFRICEELKLRQSLKTILLPLPLLTRQVETCSHPPIFHPR